MLWLLKRGATLRHESDLLSVGGMREKISIVFSPSETSRQEVVELLSALSELYSVLGGDELIILDADAGEKTGEEQVLEV